MCCLQWKAPCCCWSLAFVRIRSKYGMKAFHTRTSFSSKARLWMLSFEARAWKRLVCWRFISGSVCFLCLWSVRVCQWKLRGFFFTALYPLHNPDPVAVNDFLSDQQYSGTWKWKGLCFYALKQKDIAELFQNHL